ncbi:50S ribosomal protein L28, partial [Campylobacter jejuni]|nr:50S ribosomal protein L28 [Campylobacter jejuni]ECQ0498878.1 50S ribosomal protein L28 [Campylobacter jejuni]
MIESSFKNFHKDKKMARVCQITGKGP